MHLSQAAHYAEGALFTTPSKVRAAIERLEAAGIIERYLGTHPSKKEPAVYVRLVGGAHE